MKVKKMSELEANALCEYLGYDFKDNDQFYKCMKENGYIEVYNNDIEENEYIINNAEIR